MQNIPKPCLPVGVWVMEGLKWMSPRPCSLYGVATMGQARIRSQAGLWHGGLVFRVLLATVITTVAEPQAAFAVLVLRLTAPQHGAACEHVVRYWYK